MEAATYDRISKTWGKNEGVQDLIISNVQADIARRIAAQVKIVEIESTDAPEPVDQEKYAGELQQELLYLYNRLHVPESKRHRERGQLRDSSVELADPLEPRVGEIDENEERGGIEDDGRSSGDNRPDEGSD